MTDLSCILMNRHLQDKSLEKLFFLRIFLSFLLILFSITISAQIGINTENPEVTLDLNAGETAGATAEGLLIPRLSLSELTSKDLLYSANARGTLIYVTKIDGTTTTVTKEIIRPGFYSFDGAKWITLRGADVQDFFYMPPILLSMDESDLSYNTINNRFEINVYDSYVSQLSLSDVTNTVKNPSAVTSNIFTKTELDFFVTYYDSSVFKNVSITNNGDLYYELQQTLERTPKTFMNIIFKIKE